MESLQLIKSRIRSIESTRQITKSMRMVSTAKVQRARSRMEENRHFLKRAQSIISTLSDEYAIRNHPHFIGRKNESGVSAVVLICGDRGLCGGYNMNVCRKATTLIHDLGKVKIITVGIKARDYCKRRHKSSLADSYTGISENPFPEDIAEITGQLIQWYEDGEIDAVYLVHSKFQSMLVQIPTANKLLPVTLQEPQPEAVRSIPRFEPPEDEIMDYFTPFYLTSFIYSAVLESSACEQSARIASMDTAIKSADEMISSLTLQYNRVRQTAITQEIVEVVSGGNARKNK